MQGVRASVAPDTGYYIRGDYIYGPHGETGFHVARVGDYGYIYSADGDTGHYLWIQGDYAYIYDGNNRATEFYVWLHRDYGYIYGPSNGLPWQ
jgi:hypothetical protein